MQNIIKNKKMKTSTKHFSTLFLLFLCISNYYDLKSQTLNSSTFKGTYQTDLLPDKNEQYLQYYLDISGNSAIMTKITYKKKEYDKNLMAKLPKTLALLKNSFIRLSSNVEFNAIIEPLDKLGEFVIIDSKTDNKLMNIRIFDNYLLTNNSSLYKLEENIRLYQSILYYNNGQRRATGRYENGKREGNWSFFDEDGNRTVKRFDNGIETHTYKKPTPDAIRND